MPNEQSLRNLFAEKLELPPAQVLVSEADGVWSVRVWGPLKGESLDNAIRRRRKIEKLAKKIVDGLRERVVFSLDFDDAVKKLTASIEGVIRAASFGSDITPQVSIDSTGAVSVTVTTINAVDEKLTKPIEAFVRSVCETHGATLLMIHWPNAKKARTVASAEVLRAIKVFQPATFEQISLAVAKSRGKDFDDSKLPAAIDRCRHGGYAIRLKDGRYVLTAQGLKALPSPSGHHTSDIQRVLELGLRGRYSKGGR